jgi:hypothetical protein
MTRTGKIARLPQTVREELNRRLTDGEPGKRLVVWLNRQATVWDVLRTEFAGRPISEQNLSEWKQGGFEDWRRHRETLAVAGRLLEEAEDLEEFDNGGIGADRFAEMAAIVIARLLQETGRMAEGPEKCRTTLAVVRELIQLRRADRDYERAMREEELHERETEDYRKGRRDARERSVQLNVIMLQRAYEEGRTARAAHLAKGEPVPADLAAFLAREAQFKRNYEDYRRHLDAMGRALREGNPAESDQIRLDQT